MMNCHEAHKLVVQAQDTRLPFARRIGLRFHLLICKACAAFEHQMAFLRAACRSYPGSDE
jgi:hypothetical protein